MPHFPRAEHTSHCHENSRRTPPDGFRQLLHGGRAVLPVILKESIFCRIIYGSPQSLAFQPAEKSNPAMPALARRLAWRPVPFVPKRPRGGRPSR
jgi:hypothetical protein